MAQAPDDVIALETLRSTPDRLVVLLDVMMPRLDGRGVLQAVTDDVQLMRQHRFVVMTADANALNDSLTQLMRQVGASALIKPFSIDHLLALMSEAASQLTN